MRHYELLLPRFTKIKSVWIPIGGRFLSFKMQGTVAEALNGFCTLTHIARPVLADSLSHGSCAAAQRVRSHQERVGRLAFIINATGPSRYARYLLWGIACFCAPWLWFALQRLRERQNATRQCQQLENVPPSKSRRS